MKYRADAGYADESDNEYFIVLLKQTDPHLYSVETIVEGNSLSEMVNFLSDEYDLSDCGVRMEERYEVPDVITLAEALEASLWPKIPA